MMPELTPDETHPMGLLGTARMPRPHSTLKSDPSQPFPTSKPLIPAGAHYTEVDAESKRGRQPSKMALQTLASWHSCPCIILPFECGLDLVTCF